ncbi:MAG: copper resistance CopC/CopD family protein, partial [Anaerolineales bacterium]
MRRPLILVLTGAGAGLAALILAGTASAHAVLVRSEPVADGMLVTAPTTIELWFSEPLEPAFSSARLIDTTGAEVPTGAPLVDPADPLHLTVPLGGLQPGIYTVAWQTLSKVDGHEWFGSLPFTLLNPDGSQPGGSAASAEGSQRGELPSPLEAGVRWLLLLGGMLLFGSLIFRALLIDPVRFPQLGTAFLRLLSVIVVGGSAAILLGNFAQLWLQAQRLGGLDELPELITSTRTGAFLLGRVLLVGGLVIAVRRMDPHRRTPAGGRVPLVLAASILLSFSAGSHAGAAPGSLFVILSDFLHLLSASAWVAGLVLLPILGLRARQAGAREEFLPLVRRFSLLAGAAVYILAFTGIFAALVELPDLPSLWTSPYGRVLSVKLALFAVALGFAYFNNRSLQAAEVSPRLPRRIAWEGAFGVLLVVSVSVLVQTPTPRSLGAPSQPAGTTLPFSSILPADDLTIHLQVDPNQAGSNQFWLHLFRIDASSIGEVQLVRLFFDYQDQALGKSIADLDPLGQDTFGTEGAYLSQAGRWKLQVYVRRRGVDDVLASFDLNVAPGAAASAAQGPLGHPVPGMPVLVLVGGLVLCIGLVPLLWRKELRSGFPAVFQKAIRVGGALTGVGFVALVFGVADLVSAEVPLLQRTNPIPASAESIARGQEIFSES